MIKLYPTQNHPSFFHEQKIVYPVVSRRSGGVSIGLNLSPSKRCNFACIYCQVQFTREKNVSDLSFLPLEVDLQQLESELRKTIDVVQSGRLFLEERFAETPSEKRVLRDFAFSGDGEPTLSPQFAEAAQILTQVRKELALHSVKIVLITNATTLQTPKTIEGCDIITANNGEIWGKLDGGSSSVYSRMNRSKVPFETILENLSFAAKRWPIKVQTMFLVRGGEKPSESEKESYVAALDRIHSNGGEIRGIQLYTVARPPAESGTAPLSNGEMDELAGYVRRKTGLEVDVFYSR